MKFFIRDLLLVTAVVAPRSEQTFGSSRAGNSTRAAVKLDEVVLWEL
jgi:hypothetical protein